MGKRKREHYEKVCGIYKITNNINGKCYIGQSIDIYYRWFTHQNPKIWQSDKGKALYRAFIKYGIDNFMFEIIEVCPRKKLDEREKHWISFYKSYKDGYNMTKGGQGNKNRDWIHRSSKKQRINWFWEFIEYLGEKHFDIYDTFNEIKMALCPDIDNLDDVENDEIRDEIDGYDTLMRDFCDGYENFEQWAECNLI